MQVQVKTNVLAKNDAIAESLQQLFKEKNIFVFNLLGSPGAGKTSLLEATLQDLKKDYTIVMVTHNMQQAARVSDKTAFFLTGEVIEMDSTERMFSNPQDKRTEDYITGRFG